MHPFLYPVALDVRQRLCVVVGAGAVGERRAQALLDAGARVRVVAPAIRPTLAELLTRMKGEYTPAAFRPEHLDGAFLAVAATDDPAVNAEVAAAARDRALLVNQAAPGEAGESGDFVTMSAIQRGDLVVAVTTGGAGPAIAARVRRDLETQFGPEWEDYIALLGEMREIVKKSIGSPGERQAALRRLAEADSVRQQIAAGDPESARKAAMACIS